LGEFGRRYAHNLFYKMNHLKIDKVKSSVELKKKTLKQLNRYNTHQMIGIKLPSNVLLIYRENTTIKAKQTFSLTF